MNRKRFLRAGLGLATVFLMVFLATGMAQAASRPSCRSMTYTGPDGFLAVQTSPSGSVAWGGELNNKVDEAGHYVINVLVNGKRARPERAWHDGQAVCRVTDGGIAG